MLLVGKDPAERIGIVGVEIDKNIASMIEDLRDPYGVIVAARAAALPERAGHAHAVHARSAAYVGARPSGSGPGEPDVAEDRRGQGDPASRYR